MRRKWDLQRSGSAAGHGQGPVQDGAEELPLMSKEEAAGTILDRALAMAGC